MEKELKDKVERYKAKADIFLNNNTQAFIVDNQGNYFFCNIRKVEEDFVIVYGFAGKRKFEQDKIYFVDVVRFEEYEEKEEVLKE